MRGLMFERYVADLYRDLGKFDVKHNKTILLNKDNKQVKVQIDVSYRNLFLKHFVECKYRSDSYVNLENVAKFCAVLDLMNIKHSRGEMITNTDYTRRARVYASEQELTLINGKQLVELEKQRLPFFIGYLRKINLENLIAKYEK